MPDVTPVPRLARIARLGALVVLVAAGCATRPDVSVPSATVAAPPSAPSAVASAPAASSSGAASSSTPTPVASPWPPAGPGDRPDLAAVGIRVDQVLGGFHDPLFVTAPNDGSGRLFVVEQGGVIRIVRDGRLVDAPFLDISDRVTAGGERGLLGLAFPPGFGPERPQFYVHYSNRKGDTTISRFTVRDGSPDTADPASEQILLTQQQPYPNHNGGWIGFDPDGMLLIGLGDGGSAGDPQNRASNLDTLLGKMLRIDVLGAPAGTAYAIPADNPYVARPGARPEILHSGLRNPFRDSVDLETGNLWIGDVGQDAWEEVDVAPAGSRGLDFGWRRWEGDHCYDRAAGCDRTGVTMPVTEYSHAEGCSIIGGVVYRGDLIPPLRGGYLFGDFCSGRLWAIDAGLDGTQAPILLAETGRSISSIGTDADGEVWLTDLRQGQLLRLAPAS